MRIQKNVFSLGFFILLLTVAACAERPHQTESSSMSTVTTVFKGARIIDGTGNSAFENANLVIQGDHIVAIQAPTVRIPEGAQVLDMHGKTILPTLITAHTHLGQTEGTEFGSKHITEENVLHQLQKFTLYGVGVVTSLGTDLDFIYNLRARGLSQDLQIPLILTAGHGFGIPNGAPPEKMGLDQVYRPKNIRDVKNDMQELVSHHPDLVKIWIDDFDHSMKHKMDESLYKEIITEAHAAHLKVAAHVFYLDDAKHLASAGVDLFAHSVRDQRVDKGLIALMRKNHVAYIPTLSLDEAFFIYAEHPKWMEEPFFKNALDPGVEIWLKSENYKPKEKSRADLKIAKENMRRLFQAGIPIGMGTDSGATISRIQGFAEHHELELLVSAGLAPMQAIKSATSTNAEILGISNRYGVLAPGKKASLLILNDNPLEDIRNTHSINSVWLEGVQKFVAPTGSAF